LSRRNLKRRRGALVIVLPKRVKTMQGIPIGACQASSRLTAALGDHLSSRPLAVTDARTGKASSAGPADCLCQANNRRHRVTLKLPRRSVPVIAHGGSTAGKSENAGDSNTKRPACNDCNVSPRTRVRLDVVVNDVDALRFLAIIACQVNGVHGLAPGREPAHAVPHRYRL